MVLFQKNNFQRLKSYFWLVGRSCNASIRSRGEKAVRQSFFPHIYSATAFGWGLGRIAPACHGFASAGAVTLGSALSPLLPLWGCSLWTLPWPSHGHPKCDCTITRKPMVHWATLTLSQMLWGHSNMSECVRKKLFAGWKVYFPPDIKGALPLRPDNQKKLFSFWKFFWPFPTQKVSK